MIHPTTWSLLSTRLYLSTWSLVQGFIFFYHWDCFLDSILRLETPNSLYFLAGHFCRISSSFRFFNSSFVSTSHLGTLLKEFRSLAQHLRSSAFSRIFSAFWLVASLGFLACGCAFDSRPSFLAHGFLSRPAFSARGGCFVIFIFVRLMRGARVSNGLVELILFFSSRGPNLWRA